MAGLSGGLIMELCEENLARVYICRRRRRCRHRNRALVVVVKAIRIKTLG